MPEVAPERGFSEQPNLTVNALLDALSRPRTGRGGRRPPNMDAWRTDGFLQFDETTPPILWKWFRHKG